MLVDPTTGMPIEESGTTAQSAVGAAGQAAVGDSTSLTYELMGHLPGAGTIAAWNMGRGMNTIMRGGYNRGRRGPNMGTRPVGLLPKSSSIANTLSPMRLTSFSDPANITGVLNDGSPGGKATYSPFNFMGDMANKGAQAIAKRVPAAELAQNSIDITDKSVASKMMTRMGVPQQQIKNVAEGNAQVFDSGVLARLGASQQLGYMRPGKDGDLSRGDRKKLAKSIYSMDRMGIDVSGIPGSDDVLNTVRGGRFATGGVRAGADALTGPKGVGAARMATSTMMGSFKGIGTQKMAGYLGGLMPGGTQVTQSAAYKGAFAKGRANIRGAGKLLDKSTQEVLEAGGGKSLRMAGQAAMKKGGGKAAAALATKGLTKIGTKFIPIVGQIALAADLGNMALATAKKGAEIGREASKSFQGQIQKPIFGMGYKDNEINATSRSRGLTAIQSSRLNARNALGHEAGMLSTHFG